MTIITDGRHYRRLPVILTDRDSISTAGSLRAGSSSDWAYTIISLCLPGTSVTETSGVTGCHGREVANSSGERSL